jgi:hypothetical protein
VLKRLRSATHDASGALARVGHTASVSLTPAWPLFQATAAAAVSWIIARMIGDHPNPFFAPMATIVALNAPWGERGRQAIRLIIGVVLGIAVAEILVFALPTGVGTLILATFVAMALARAFGAARIVIIQAAVSAILTVSVADGEAGFERLLDASIGVGVALLFSQVLFSPEPVALLRRAESVALTGLAEGLAAVARGLQANDAATGGDAVSDLRALRDQLGELARLRRASPRVARHSAIWRSRETPAVEESEHADNLDLLSSTCVLLSRAALRTSPESQRWLAPRVETLAGVLQEMAGDPGNREKRQRAADTALDVTRQLLSGDKPSLADLDGPIFLARMAAFDIMVFAGAPPEESRAAIRETAAAAGELVVADMPSTRGLPFDLDRWRGWRSRRSASKLPDWEPTDTDVGSKE